MESFDFRGFMSDHFMSIEHACRVFRVSRRTVIRWRVDAALPAPAAQLARTIQRDSPPWSKSFWRGWQPGIRSLPDAWRVDLFGDEWRQVFSPAELAEKAAARARADAWRAKHEAKAAQRREAARKARSERMRAWHAARRATG